MVTVGIKIAFQWSIVTTETRGAWFYTEIPYKQSSNELKTDAKTVFPTLWIFLHGWYDLKYVKFNLAHTDKHVPVPVRTTVDQFIPIIAVLRQHWNGVHHLSLQQATLKVIILTQISWKGQLAVRWVAQIWQNDNIFVSLSWTGPVFYAYLRTRRAKILGNEGRRSMCNLIRYVLIVYDLVQCDLGPLLLD